MDKISTHFRRSEFACKCKCGFSAVDLELVAILEDVRDYFQDKFPLERVTMEISSGCRCPKYNAKVGGAPESFHVKAMAADIKVWERWQVAQINPDFVADYLEKAYALRYGIGRYSTFTHLDVRPNCARWDKRK